MKIKMKKELAQYHLPVSIQTDQDEEQDGESEQGGSPITHKGQRDTDHGSQPNGHGNIDGDMEEKYRGHPIGITAAESTALSFGDGYDPEKQDQV